MEMLTFLVCCSPESIFYSKCVIKYTREKGRDFFERISYQRHFSELFSKDGVVLVELPYLVFKSLAVSLGTARFNIQKFCCIYLRTNGDLCHLQHKLVGFYNRDEKCLQRGTNWVFK